MNPTVTLAMIVKNEEENLVQCLNSVRAHVDQCVIVDTGSTDKTKEVAVKFGCDVYDFNERTHPQAFFMDDEKTCTEFGAPGPFSNEIAFGDFGAAREYSFQQATCDYVIWTDADDVVEGAEHIHAIAADMQQRGMHLGFLRYDYVRDHLGRVFYEQRRERIIQRGVANWFNPVHEVLMPNQPINYINYDQVFMSHHRKADRKSIPNRNYKLLLRHLKQFVDANPGKPVDPRTYFYLGQEARYIQPQKAVSFYSEYLKTSGWPEERAAAHCAIGSLLEFGQLGLAEQDAYQQANREYAVAAVEIPENPDGLFGLARIAYLRGRHQDCVRYTEQGLAKQNPPSMLGANPMDRLYRPFVYYNHSLAQLNRIPEAIAACEAGLKTCPDDPGVPGGSSGMLSYNLAYYKSVMEAQKVNPPKGEMIAEFTKHEDLNAPPLNVPDDMMLIWAIQLWKQIIASGDGERAKAFLLSLPKKLFTDPVFQKMSAITNNRFGSGGKGSSIVLWVGPGYERWTPNTPNETGLGGSETAAIEMAKNLAKLGHEVTVCAECDGIFDGVSYVHHSKINNVVCDVFICSRQPWAVENLNVKAKLKLLWVHDIHHGPSSPQMERCLYQYDRVLCLSNWHKNFFLQSYPTLHPNQVIVTRNGIDPSRFYNEVPKQNRMVFSSSPNRGLPNLLYNLQFIQKAVPDVHLDIFYGFDTWESIARMHNNQAELDQIAGFKQMIDGAVKAGVATFHGKSSQKKLADAFMRAKCWGYCTEFPETSCISAMEAQAAGAVPVTTKFAALAETVQHGVLIDPGPTYGDTFVKYCIQVLTDEKFWAGMAVPGRKYALEKLSWESLAKDWSKMFEKLQAEVESYPIPLWREAA